MAAFGGGEDVLFRFLLDGLKLKDVAVEFAGVGADEGVAFSHLGIPSALVLVYWYDGDWKLEYYLRLGIWLKEDGLEGVHGGEC